MAVLFILIAVECLQVVELVFHLRQFSRGRIDDKATNDDVLRNERMVLHTIHCFMNTTLRVPEAFKPLTYADMFFYFVDLVFWDALSDEFFQWCPCILPATQSV